MRTGILLVLAAVLAASVSPALGGASRPEQQPAGQEIAAGEVLPDFTLANLKGEEVTLSDFRGKVVFLNFWATWCPPCKAEMPSMGRLHEAFAGKNFAMLAVSIDEDPDAARDYIAKNPHGFQVLLDAEATVQDLYGVFRVPETFIVDQDGKLVKRFIGARDWSSVEFMKELAVLVEGKNRGQ